MQLIITGTDEQGRSTILEIRDPMANPVDSTGYSRRGEMWATTQQPFELVTPRTTVEQEMIDLELAPGGTKWMMVELAADSVSKYHRTDTLDYDVILSGEVELVLETGAVTMRPGDSVVMSGVLHQWKTGPDGVTMSVVVLGIPPAS